MTTGITPEMREKFSQLGKDVFIMPMQEGCHECLAKRSKTGAKLLFCSQCKIARYCSVKCQKRHWKRAHKVECKIIAEGAGVNPSLEVQRLLNRAQSARTDGRLEKSIKLTKQALKVIRKPNHFGSFERAFPEMEANCVEKLSHMYAKLGNGEKSLKYGKEYIELVERLPWEADMSDTKLKKLNDAKVNYANLLKMSGDKIKAEQLMPKSTLSLDQQLFNINTEIAPLYKAGNFEAAYQKSLTMLPLLEPKGAGAINPKPYRLAHSLHMIAHYAMCTHRLADVVEYGRRAEEAIDESRRRQEDEFNEEWTKSNYASLVQVYIALGKKEEAVEYLGKLARLKSKKRFRAELGRVLPPIEATYRDRFGEPSGKVNL